MSPRTRRNAVSYFNVMVVGFSGVGKTAFIRTLVEALKAQVPKEDRVKFISLTSTRDGATDGPLEKTLQPYAVNVEISVNSEKVILTFIDTPGFSADYLFDKQLCDIMGYIEHQFDLTLAEESKVKRNPKAADTQVHACLYVIDPTKQALDAYDLRILTHLTKRVNVIPVIGKADTLTRAQRQRLKPSIIRDIYLNKIPVYGLPDDDVDEEEEEDYNDNREHEGTENGHQKQNKPTSLDDFLQQFDYEQEDEETRAFLDYLQLIPFSVIAYEADPDTGRPIELEGIAVGRDYGWGKIDCMNNDHCDSNRVKNMFLFTHRRILQAETQERYYEQYRTEKLIVRRATSMKNLRSK